MSAQKKNKDRYREIRNAKARREYLIEEKLEAGVVLTGTEVKSIRAGQAQINEAFVRIDKGKPVLYHAHIAEYSHGTDANHNPYRPRPLLLHQKEIEQLEIKTKTGGRTIIPLRIYFKKALIKVEIALAQGKKTHDKREDLKKAAAKREMDRVTKNF